MYILKFNIPTDRQSVMLHLSYLSVRTFRLKEHLSRLAIAVFLCVWFCFANCNVFKS